MVLSLGKGRLGREPVNGRRPWIGFDLIKLAMHASDPSICSRRLNLSLEFQGKIRKAVIGEPVWKLIDLGTQVLTWPELKGCNASKGTELLLMTQLGMSDLEVM